MTRCNYHTHTARCKHASGIDEEYVINAIKNGFTEIGFSDHSPWPLAEGENNRIRMDLSEFDDYYNSIASLKEKYKDQIKILIGLECEYLPDRMEWLKKFKEEKGLDYLILGNHFDKKILAHLYFGNYRDLDCCLTNYVDDAIAALETGLFSYLAHPDLFMRTFGNWSKDFEAESIRLLTYCKEHNIPIEYNLAGIRDADIWFTGYPCPDFWQLVAKVGNVAVIGLDAHAPENFNEVDVIDKSREYLQSLGLTVIDKVL